MIMGERTRYKLQCLCGNTGWAEWSDNDPAVDVSSGFSWAKGGKAFYAFYGGALSCLRCGAEPTATSGRQWHFAHVFVGAARAGRTRPSPSSCGYRAPASPTKCVRSIGGECLANSGQIRPGGLVWG